MQTKPEFGEKKSKRMGRWAGKTRTNKVVGVKPILR